MESFQHSVLAMPVAWSSPISHICHGQEGAGLVLKNVCVCFYHLWTRKWNKPTKILMRTTSRIIPTSSLTLLSPRGGGTMCPPCHVFAYIWANTRSSALEKLDFSQLWVWKRAVHFLPHKVISFRWKKNKVRRKYENFIRGDPYELG